ncbi:MAG: hypothetical protein WCZ17_11225, partial [Candidatus Kapaibacterium sp.]
MYSQNVGIGDQADFTPHNSALLELRSNSRGFLMPQMTAAQKNAIVSPAHGLLIVQTDIQPSEPSGIWYYDGLDSQWKNIYSTSISVSFGDLESGTNTDSEMIVGGTATITLAGSNSVIESNKFSGEGSLTDAIDLNTNETSGVLSTDKGGTGLNTLPPSGSFIYSNGTTYSASSQPTASGQVPVYDLNTGSWEMQVLDFSTLDSSKVWIGSSSDSATAKNISGDASLNSEGEVTVTGLRSHPISNLTPTSGQILQFNSISGHWEPVTVASVTPTWILTGDKLHPNPLNDWYSMQWGNGVSSEHQATAFGGGTASANRATAWGTGTVASQNLTTAWGQNTVASGNLATVWGDSNIASGALTSSWGLNNEVSGYIATAWGGSNLASANYASVWGENNISSAGYSTAWGSQSQATGQYSTAFGKSDTASGFASVSFGENNNAIGNYSFAFGKSNRSQGIYSIAGGHNTTAFSGMETVFGQFNSNYTAQNSWDWSSPDRLFVLGNGSSNNSRSDALIVYKDGNSDLFGNLALKNNTNNMSSELRLYQPSQYGNYYSGFKSDSLSQNLVYTLPKDEVSNEISILVNSGNNNLKWMKTGDLQAESKFNILDIINQSSYTIPDTVTHVLVNHNQISNLTLYSGIDNTGKVVFIKRISPDHVVQICPGSGQTIDG